MCATSVASGSSGAEVGDGTVVVVVVVVVVGTATDVVGGASAAAPTAAPASTSTEPSAQPEASNANAITAPATTRSDRDSRRRDMVLIVGNHRLAGVEN